MSRIFSLILASILLNSLKAQLCADPNMVYKTCGSPCPKTCIDLNPHCPQQCIAGCFCTGSTNILALDGTCVTRAGCSAMDNTPDECGHCVSNCNGVCDGDYTSCNGCHVYATCIGGVLSDNRPCAPNNPNPSLMWNDEIKACDYSSSCEIDPC
eukprot:UN07171